MLMTRIGCICAQTRKASESGSGYLPGKGDGVRDTLELYFAWFFEQLSSYCGEFLHRWSSPLEYMSSVYDIPISAFDSSVRAD